MQDLDEIEPYYSKLHTMQQVYTDLESLPSTDPVRLLKVTGKLKPKQFNREYRRWEFTFKSGQIFVDSQKFHFEVALPVQRLQDLYNMIDFTEISELTFNSELLPDLDNEIITFTYKVIDNEQ